MSSDKMENLVEKLRGGCEEAASEVFRRYSDRLLALAESRLNAQIKGRVGADDIVQSVFRTFFRRSLDGQFTFDHTGALWRLLVTITKRKCSRAARPHPKSPLAKSLDAEDGVEIAGGEPSPEEVATVIDLTQRMLEKFASHERAMIELRFQGYSTSEIGEKLGCSRQTVWRALDRAEKILQHIS